MKNRKKISIIFAGLIFGIININTVFGATGTITTETIRIREKASTDSKILDIGSLNEKVEILGQEDGWYKVEYKGKTGYIYREYLKPDEEVEQTTTPSVEPTTVVSPDPSTEPTTKPIQNNVEKKLGNITNKQTDTYLTPNFSSIKISKIETGVTVEVITTLANWSKVKVNNEEGWIPNIVLMEEVQTNPEELGTEENPEEKVDEKTDETPEKQAEEPQSNETQINQKGYISSNAQANLRSGPSTSNESLGKLKKHTVITIISEENDWYKVSYNGKEGYISKSLVTIGEVPEETSSRSGDISRTQELSNNNNSSDVVSVAKQYLGNKYVSGGTSPESGFDCSGFTQYVYNKCGISLSRASSTQANNGTPVDKSELQPGDLLLFHYYGESSIGHVGIYTGNGQFIHAANSKRGVVYDTIESGYYADNYAGARRF